MAKPLIFVTVGTSKYPFNRLVSKLEQNPLYNSNECEWAIQYGYSSIVKLPQIGKTFKYLSHNEIEALAAKATLVISHAGIGSIYLLLKYRKHAILMPRVKQYKEHVDDHQLEISRQINSHRIAVVYPEDQFPKIDLSSISGSNETSSATNIINLELAAKIEQELSR